MKEFLSALIVIATFSAAPVLAGVVAQAESGQHHAAWVERALDLTPQERQQAEPILRDTARRMHELHSRTSAAALAALSPDHRSRVREIAAGAHQQLRAHPEPQHGLTRSEIAPIFTKSAGEIDALLTPQESQAVLAQRQEFEAGHDAIWAETVAQLRPLLSGEQQQKLDAWSAKVKEHEAQRHQPDAGRFLLMAAAPPKG
ncbi:hypothetical protein EPN52_13345 [bacterium]|nr:MAG: hypothetical protein EPN52_13345 [bacterium]